MENKEYERKELLGMFLDLGERIELMEKEIPFIIGSLNDLKEQIETISGILGQHSLFLIKLASRPEPEEK